MLQLVILNNSDERAAQYLEQSSGRIYAALVRQMGAEMMNLRSYTQAEKLSGQMVNRLTGKLSDSLMDNVEASGDKILGTVDGGKEIPYAPDVYFGTRPHEIVPQGRALCFMYQGRRVFSKRVNHPGTAARPFLQSALDDRKQAIVANLTQAVAEANQ